MCFELEEYTGCIAEGSENHCYPVPCNLADKRWQRVNHSPCKTRNKSLQQMVAVGGVLQPAALQDSPCRVCTG